MTHPYLYSKVEIPDSGEELEVQVLFDEVAEEVQQRVLLIFDQNELESDAVQSLIEFIKAKTSAKVEFWGYTTSHTVQDDFIAEYKEKYLGAFLAYAPNKVLCFGKRAAAPFYASKIESDTWYPPLLFTRQNKKSDKGIFEIGFLPLVSKMVDNKSRSINFIKEMID
jgi:hypothetical protein